MLKLPNLEKNSYLSIYIKQDNILANLAYVDYVSGRNYILSDNTSIESDSDTIYTDIFWKEYFEELEKRFNWEFFRGTELMSVASEGIGVAGINVCIAGEKLRIDDLMSCIRNVSFGITFEKVGKGYLEDILKSICNRLEYKDIVYVDADLMNFKITRVRKVGESGFLTKPKGDNFQSITQSISWNYKGSLVQNIHNSKLEAFLSFEIEKRKLSNIWANFVNVPILTTNSKLLRDIIRSYMSVQLITLINDSKGKLNDIGSDGETLVIFTGNLSKLLLDKELFLTILDGLELRGAIDLLIDDCSRVVTLGKEYSLGIESTSFIVTHNDLFNNLFRIVVGELRGNDFERKIGFSGKMEFSETGISEVYAFTPEINVFNIDNKKGYLYGKFLKGVYWGSNNLEFEIFSDPAKISYKSVVVDLRPKPVVYGPDGRSNRNKLSAWINEAGK